MLLRNRIILSLVVPVLAFLVGCGSSTNHPVPPPTGGFSNSNLNGTYVFSSSGIDENNGFVAMVGSFTANGSGGITGGNIDVNAFDFGGSSGPITGGSYSVSADGRGKVSLTSSTSVDNVTTLDFVLTSSSHGLVSFYDSDGSGVGNGSGTLDLQASVSQSQLANNKYVFNLVGVGGAGGPLATVGSVTLDSAGNATGTQDLNNSGTFSSTAVGSPSNITIGSVPGTATIGSFVFDVYPIDATHMKFIEADANGIMAGDVFSQTSSTFPSGQIAFTLAGVDNAGPVPMALGGLMTSDGTSTISTGVEDFNDGGIIDGSGTTLTPQGFTGGFATSGSRFSLTLNNFINGQNVIAGTFQFVAYPSTGGIQLLESDGGGVTGGVAYAQSNTNFASGQGYGLNLTSSNSGGFEEDDIAEFTNTNNSFTGLIDQIDQGSVSSPQKFTASYNADATNAGRAVITANFFTLASYTVDANTTIFIEVDDGSLGLLQLGLGSMGLQSASSQNVMAARLASVKAVAKVMPLKPKMPAHMKAWKKLK